MAKSIHQVGIGDERPAKRDQVGLARCSEIVVASEMIKPAPARYA